MKKQGWVGLPIDVVKFPDGRLVAIDNTRYRINKQGNSYKKLYPDGSRFIGSFLCQQSCRWGSNPDASISRSNLKGNTRLMGSHS